MKDGRQMRDAPSLFMEDNIIPTSSSLSKLFEIQAARMPKKVAVKCGKETITYEDLNRAGNRIARFLSRHGTKREDIVAILMERSIPMILSILAVWKCGAAYVLLDPTHSDERIDELVNIIEPGLLLTQSRYKSERLASLSSSTIINVDKVPLELAGSDDGNLDIESRKEDLCYVFFTSGSTGKPKGALLEHNGVINHMWAKISDIGLGTDSWMAQTSTQNFNIFNWQTFAPLVVGATTVIYSDHIIRTPGELIKHLVDDKISFLQISPSYLNILFDYLEGKNIKFDALKKLLLTGEPVKPVTVNRWFALYPEISILNSYGCTEVSDDSIHKVFNSKLNEDQHVPVGKPITNTTVHIVKINNDGSTKTDDLGKPLLCNAGETGRIWLSGNIVVGRGYINNKKETMKYFSSDPFTGERLFKIGDLGYLSSNGDFVCLGREDSQVKINGQRIDICEIETQILSHAPEIKDVVVIPHKNENNQAYLTAYFTASRPFKILELRGFNGVLKHLPSYMVPQFWVQLEEFPILKDSGKTDRRQLPPPNGDYRLFTHLNKMVRADIERPRNEEDRFLAEMWSDVLNTRCLGIDKSNIGINECFFNVGGDSLKAALLARKLEEKGYEFNLEAFYQASAIKERGRYLKKKTRDCTALLDRKVFKTSWEETCLGQDFKQLAFHMFTIDQYLHDRESEGKDVIRMTLGKSDRPLHGAVKDAMKKVLDRQSEILKVDSEGNWQLREEISKYYRDRFEVEIPIANIVVGSQGTSSIYRDLFLILLQDGGEVLLPKPGYILYEASASLAKGMNAGNTAIRYYDINLETNKIDMESMQRNFSPENTRIVVVNSPGNPSGNLVSAGEWKNIVNIINTGKQAVLFSDQVYNNIVFDNKEYPSVFDVELRNPIKRPVVVSDSMSKGFEMYTYRVGYAILPHELVNPLVTFQRNFSLTPNTISQFGAIEALRNHETVRSLSRLLEERRDYALKAFGKTAYVKMVKSDGGFYFLLNCEEYMELKKIGDDFELAKRIAAATNPHVGVTPGSDFGAPDFLRVSLSPRDFDRGIDLLVEYFNRHV